MMFSVIPPNQYPEGLVVPEGYFAVQAGEPFNTDQEAQAAFAQLQIDNPNGIDLNDGHGLRPWTQAEINFIKKLVHTILVFIFPFLA